MMTILKTLANVGSVIIDYDVKERDHCQITVKYRGSSH